MNRATLGIAAGHLPHKTVTVSVRSARLQKDYLLTPWGTYRSDDGSSYWVKSGVGDYDEQGVLDFAARLARVAELESARMGVEHWCCVLAWENGNEDDTMVYFQTDSV